MRKTWIITFNLEGSKCHYELLHESIRVMDTFFTSYKYGRPYSNESFYENSTLYEMKEYILTFIFQILRVNILFLLGLSDRTLLFDIYVQL